jgi:tetratricopeptide (TPR) repeat protein
VHKMMEMKTKNCWHTGITNGYKLLDLARNWLKQGNTVVAGELLRSAANTRETAHDPKLRARILKESGRVRMMESDWETASAMYLEAQRVFLDLGDKKGAAECSRNLANMVFQKGEYSEAEVLCQQALEWATEANDYELRATVLNTLAAIASARGEHRKAIKAFRLCLSDFQSAGNAIRRGYVLLNIGLALTELNEHEEAATSLTEALTIALEEQDLHLVEICYQNIARCYLARGELHLTRSVIDTARRMLPALNSPALACELDLLDGRVRRMLGDFSGAMSILERSHATAVENHLTALVADFLYEQGVAAKEAGKTDMAISKLNTAVQQYQSLGVTQGTHDARNLLEQLRGRPCA